MGPLRALQGRCQHWRVQKQFDKALLVFERQADDLGFLDGLLRGFLSGGHEEIADTAALERGGALNNPQRIGRNASFNAGGSAGSLEHGSLSNTYCTGVHRTMQL